VGVGLLFGSAAFRLFAAAARRLISGFFLVLNVFQTPQSCLQQHIYAFNA
jgi:hypothetical protein